MDLLTVDKSIRHWWVFLLRGLLFIAVGIYMLCEPGNGFAAIGIMLGVTVFIAGLSELLHAYNSATSRGWHLFLGLVDIVLGGLLISNVGFSEGVIRVVVGLWFLFRGISMLRFSGFFRKSVIMGLGGLLTLAFALLILFNATFGGMAIIVFVAIAFIITGLLNVIQGWGMKRN